MFEELKLPNDRLAKFKELLIERDYAESDARSAARQVGIDPASATATEAAANAVNKIDDQIKTLLGTADFERYTELVGLDLFRANVAQSTIEGYLLDNGSPLAPQQSKSLAQAFYREFLNQSREPNRRTMETAASAGLTPSQRSIVDQARQFLTTEQIEALQNFFISDNELGALIAASPTRNSP